MFRTKGRNPASAWGRVEIAQRFRGGDSERKQARRAASLAMVVIALTTSAALAADIAPPKFGRPATPDEVTKADISIPPDGRGLPPGSGSVAQGAQIFAAKCAACHGANGEGTPNGDRLVGGIGTLATANPIKTVSSYWPYA